MKYQILVTQKDNIEYFEGKLSKKHEILIIERNIRNIQGNQGIVTRRGSCPLLVVNDGEAWTIAGETEQANKKHKKPPKSIKWDSLTNHEQILLTAVKFDLFEDWEDCERSAKEAFNAGDTSLNGIPRFISGQVHVLNQKKYKIVKNNGKTVVYYGPEGEQKKTLEADSLGEFIRLEKVVLHSVDFVEEK